MKVKICKDYNIDRMMYESDRRSFLRGEDRTYMSDYSSTFEERDVTMDELVELINQGVAIKINC